MTEYSDKTTGTKRSYTKISDESGKDFIKEFIIDQKQNEIDTTKLSVKTRKSIQTLELVSKSLSATNSQLIKESVKDPTILATKIWQDVGSPQEQRRQVACIHSLNYSFLNI